MKWTLYITVLLAGIAFPFTVMPHVFCDLWGWFVAPLGVQHLTHWQAFGLVLLICLPGTMSRAGKIYENNLKKKAQTDTAKEAELGVMKVFAGMAAVLIAWGMGWLVS